MVAIFRIENEHGKGIFQMDESLTRRYPHLMDMTPADDALIGAAMRDMDRQWLSDIFSLRVFGAHAAPLNRVNSKNWRFGFESRAQLEEMFPDRIARLAMRNSGFHVSVYDVPREDVFFGQFQCLFYKKNAVFIEAHDVRDDNLLPQIASASKKTGPLNLFGRQPV